MMCRPPGGLPSKSPVTTPAPPAPGTERQTDHQRAVPPAFSLCQLTRASGAVPPTFSLCQLTRASASWGLSLPARPRSAPSPDKEPPGCSHTPLAGPPSPTLTPHPAQYHLLQEAAQLSGALAAHSSRAAPLSASRHHGTAQRGCLPLPGLGPGLSKWRSQAQRGHIQGAPSHQPKASSEPEALPGSPLCPQLPRARPQDRAASDRLAPAVSAQGPAPSSGRILSKATGKAAMSGQHSSAPSEGPASPEVGPAGVCPAAGAVWDLVPRVGGLSRASILHSPSGDIRTPGGVCLMLFQRHPLARWCSPLGQLGSFPGHFGSDLLSPGLHGAGQRHSHRHPCGAGQTTLSAVS